MKLMGNIVDTQAALANLDYEPIIETVDILRRAWERGYTVFTFGNGGSHCNASHFAQDLLKACGIKAICISDMISSVLAYNNDVGKCVMFANILAWLFEENCVGIGFSCSGSSTNVLEALLNLNGNPPATSILITGNSHTEFDFDIVIKVPNPNIRIQESCHSVICHAIIEALLDE